MIAGLVQGGGRKKGDTQDVTLETRHVFYLLWYHICNCQVCLSWLESLDPVVNFKRWNIFILYVLFIASCYTTSLKYRCLYLPYSVFLLANGCICYLYMISIWSSSHMLRKEMGIEGKRRKEALHWRTILADFLNDRPDAYGGI